MSFTPDEEITLSRTVRALIDDMFERLIRIHGHLLVDHALGYLTVAKFGLTGTKTILLLNHGNHGTLTRRPCVFGLLVNSTVVGVRTWGGYVLGLSSSVAFNLRVFS